MDKKSKQKIVAKRDVVKYDANRTYFGKLKIDNLAAAYGLFKHTHDWDNPVTDAKVLVGQIDGAEICRALWYEMSYNPMRFGRVSPFIYKGREDIYHFCRCGVPEDFPGFEIIEKIRHKMIDFMTLNGRAKGQWYDVIENRDGYVTIYLVDGHSDDNYKVLSKLREMIRWVANQNLEDFKRKAYRMAMLKVIDSRHPNGVRDNGGVMQPQKAVNLPLPMTPEELAEDREDKAIESAQITAETGQYRSDEQFAQAKADLEKIVSMRKQQNTK